MHVKVGGSQAVAMDLPLSTSPASMARGVQTAQFADKVQFTQKIDRAMKMAAFLKSMDIPVTGNQTEVITDTAEEQGGHDDAPGEEQGGQ